MDDYVIHIEDSPLKVDASAWDALLMQQSHSTPFMRHAYLLALHSSTSACAATGWLPRFVTLSDTQGLAAAAVLYIKNHSYGEYVFDWAWARAYQEHGLPYYPKAVVAVPFTPVPGSRLLARNNKARSHLLQALLSVCRENGLSSLHMLFAAQDDVAAAAEAGLLLRSTVQFHWNNSTPGYRDFDAFLQSLTQEKRKKIRQERRKVSAAGITFRHQAGSQITAQDWDFFYQCYERTYLEHGNPPYLQRSFFTSMAQEMAECCLLFIGERHGSPIASSLVLLDPCTKVAFGRYWGALERVDCLHFEACYYQPLEWCIAHRYVRLEGGAQGEHKMARALMPVKTASAHWIAHPGFAKALNHYLEREDQGVRGYMEALELHTPFRQPPTA